MEKRIFISYAWEKTEKERKEINQFILWLSKALENSGFKVFVDILENKPGSNLESYMNDGIKESEFIICICTETYKKNMKYPETGVFKEIELIKRYSKLDNVIPLIRKDEFKFLPDIFNDKFVSQFKFENILSDYNTEKFKELYSALDNKSSESIKQLNYFEEQDDDIRKINLQSQLEKNCYLSPSNEATITFNYMKLGGSFVIGTGEYEFMTAWTPCGINSIYTYTHYCKCFFVRNFDEFNSIRTSESLIKINKAEIRNGWKCNVGDGIIWVNSYNKIAIGRILDVYYDSENDLNCTLTLEYKILSPLERVKDIII